VHEISRLAVTGRHTDCGFAQGITVVAVSDATVGRPVGPAITDGQFPERETPRVRSG
jgi:hypothetical protein